MNSKKDSAFRPVHLVVTEITINPSNSQKNHFSSDQDSCQLLLKYKWHWQSVSKLYNFSYHNFNIKASLLDN